MEEEQIMPYSSVDLNKAKKELSRLESLNSIHKEELKLIRAEQLSTEQKIAALKEVIKEMEADHVDH